MRSGYRDLERLILVGCQRGQRSGRQLLRKRRIRRHIPRGSRTPPDDNILILEKIICLDLAAGARGRLSQKPFFDGQVAPVAGGIQSGIGRIIHFVRGQGAFGGLAASQITHLRCGQDAPVNINFIQFAQIGYSTAAQSKPHTFE
ncbi:hypothetical protein SDC9_75262 [bioreactor metagenome]|uniref:Uncharacterized protein n=1 Tax=bioreactor metagenome TaxID=1076179 RepID=A0A644YRN0_9ZZZZ